MKKIENNFAVTGFVGKDAEIRQFTTASVARFSLAIGRNEENGEEVHATRSGRLKDFSIYDSVQEVKHREQEELAAALKLHGEKVDDGYEWHFEGECPIVAAYDYDEPCDVVILSVRANKDGGLTIIGDEKNDRGNEHEIEADDIFAGHMDFIISEIGD